MRKCCIKSNKHTEISNRYLRVKKRHVHKKAIISITRMPLVDVGITPLKTVRELLTHTAFHFIFRTLSVKQTHFNTWFKQ